MTEDTRRQQKLPGNLKQCDEQCGELCDDKCDEQRDKQSPFSPEHWQSLPSIAIVYIIVNVAKSLLSHFAYIIPALLIGLNKVKEHPLIFVPSLTALTILFVSICLAKFYSYRFRLDAGLIEIRYGVLKKTRLHIPFERIQNVILEKPMIYRASGYACVHIETAGSAESEASIVALRDPDADALKLAIMQHREACQIRGGDDINVIKEQPIIKRTVFDLFIHGATSNRVWILSGLFLGAYPQIQNTADQHLRFIEVFISNWTHYETLNTFILLKMAAIVLVLILCIVTLSIFGSIVRFFGFTLVKTKNRYIKQSGLLTRNEISIHMNRIQALESVQSWPDMIAQRHNLIYSHSRSNDLNSKKNDLLVPSTTQNDRDTLIRDLYPDSDLNEQLFTPINAYFFYRRLLYLLILTTGLLFYAWYFSHAAYWLIAIPSACLILCFLRYKAWRRYGIYIDNRYIYLRSGSIGKHISIVPIHKIQQLKKSGNAFIRARGLMNITIVIASKAYSIPCLNADSANEIYNKCLFILESKPRSWM